jgi:hypothetical protein
MLAEITKPQSMLSSLSYVDTGFVGCYVGVSVKSNTLSKCLVTLGIPKSGLKPS